MTLQQIFLSLTHGRQIMNYYMTWFNHVILYRNCSIFQINSSNGVYEIEVRSIQQVLTLRIVRKRGTRGVAAGLHLVKLSLLHSLYITKCISSYSLRTVASKNLVTHTLTNWDVWIRFPLGTFLWKNFVSTLAFAVYCHNQKDNSCSTWNVSGSRL